MNSRKYFNGSIDYCIEQLKQQKVIAYPTEAVFALGCDPDSKNAIKELLKIKKRPIEKGLILIAADYKQLEPYIADSKLSVSQRQRMLANWPGPITYLIPAKRHTMYWLTGIFNSLAVRISAHKDVQTLCRRFGKPLISTSANLSGKPPCRSINEVLQTFGLEFPALYAETTGNLNPSEIRDAVSGKLIRQG